MGDFSEQPLTLFPPLYSPSSPVRIGVIFFVRHCTENGGWRETIFELLPGSLSEIRWVWTGVHPSRVLH